MPNTSKSIIITGVKEIDRKLGRLPAAVQRKVLRRAMREGLKVVASATREDSPVLTGATRRNVKVRAVRKKRRGTIALEVRIEAVDQLKRESKKTGKTAFYPAIVEADRHWMVGVYLRTAEIAKRTTMALLLRGTLDEVGR